MPVHPLIAMSWPAVRELASDHLVAILPLGAIEAHGPHLPLGTDIVIAEAMAEAGAEQLSARGMDVLLLPALPVAPAPFAKAFAGTIDAPAAATTAQITGIARSLHRHGVRSTGIANAHHDPTHVAAIRFAVVQLAADRSAHVVFPDLTRRRWASRLSGEFQTGACHAGRYEGSIVLARAAEWVDEERLRGLPANPTSLVDAIRRGDRTFEQAGGSAAYFGWPAEATAKEGEQLIATLGAILAEAVMEELPAASRDRADSGVMRSAPKVLPAIVNPSSRPRPRGFSHGVLAPPGWRTLFVAGQTAIDDGGAAPDTFLAQFDTALGRVLEIVHAAGGDATHVARMTIYVTDMNAYRASRPYLGEAWHRRMGAHYPAMALIGVTALVDEQAVVEIEADAVLPAQESR